MRRFILIFTILSAMCFIMAEDVDFEPVSPHFDDSPLIVRTNTPSFTHNYSYRLAEVWVDTSYSETNSGAHTWQVDAFDNINDAITAIDNFGLVNLAAGTYHENLIITKPLTLSGAGNSTIIAPQSSPELYNGFYAVISVDNVYGSEENIVTIQNLKLRPSNYSWTTEHMGIMYYDASGLIDNVTIDANGTMYHNIYTLGTYGTVDITNCSISQFVRTAILAKRPGYIAGNTVHGVGYVDSGWTPNGIQACKSFYGTIENNQLLNGLAYGADWASSGIMVMARGGIDYPIYVSNNTLYNTEIALVAINYDGDYQQDGTAYYYFNDNIVYNIDTLDGTKYYGFRFHNYVSAASEAVFNSNNNTIFGDPDNSAYTYGFHLYDWNTGSAVHEMDFNLNGNTIENKKRSYYLSDKGTNNHYNLDIVNDFVIDEISGSTFWWDSSSTLNFSMTDSYFAGKGLYLSNCNVGAQGITINNNDFSDIVYGLRNRNVNTPDVTYNFWGENVFPGDMINNDDWNVPVNFSPWYTTAEMETSSTGQIAPQNIDIETSPDGTDVNLTDVTISWDAYNVGESYKIYSSTGNPYSNTEWTEEVGSQTATTWTDADVSETQKYYRVVITTNDNYASDNVYGFIKYDCEVTATTNVNFIGLPFEDGYTTAQQLAQTNSSCNAISMWNAQAQAWQTCSYFSTLDLWIGDFDLVTGASYMVGVTVAEDFIIDGHLPALPQYELIHNQTITDYNYIIVPLNNSETNSNDFIDNGIGLDNCKAISDWLPTTQEWVTKIYNTGMSQWEDEGFSVYPGKPVILSMEQDVTWPE